MEVTRKQVEELQSYFCPFGFLDMKAAIEHGQEVGLFPSEIFEIIDNDRQSYGADSFDKMDPVYCVLDHILQMARNEIDDVLGYDFQNDFHGDTEFYTYGNFMCSSYDWSEAAKDDLTDKLNKASPEQLQKLRANRFVTYFLEQVEIDITEPT